MDELLLRAADQILSAEGGNSNRSSLSSSKISSPHNNESDFSYNYEVSFLQFKRRLLRSVKNRKDEFKHEPRGHDEPYFPPKRSITADKQSQYESGKTKCPDRFNKKQIGVNKCPALSSPEVLKPANGRATSDTRKCINKKKADNFVSVETFNIEDLLTSEMIVESKTLLQPNAEDATSEHIRLTTCASDIPRANESHKVKNSSDRASVSSTESTKTEADTNKSRKKSRTIRRRRRNKSHQSHHRKRHFFRCSKCKVVYIVNFSNDIDAPVRCFSCDYWTPEVPEFLKEEKWNLNFCKIT